MQGVVFLGNRQLELRNFPDPEPGAGDVIVAIKASGPCGSDVHRYRGPTIEGAERARLCVVGHEAAGVGCRRGIERSARAAHHAARPSRVEVTARGETYVARRSYVRGSPSPDPTTYFTDNEIEDKFRRNAQGVITDHAAEAVVDAVAHLDQLHDVTGLMSLLRPTS